MFNPIASIYHSTLTAGVASLMSFAALFGLESSAQAIVLNGSFETGDFSTEWMSIGDNNIVTRTYGVTPTDGEFQALITSKYGSVTDTNLESFLDLSLGSLDTLLSANVVEGSAIKQTFTVRQGETLSFSWNFLSNETVFDDQPTTFNDLAFVSIGGTVLKIADTSNLANPSNTIFDTETGYKTFSYTFTQGGTYLLGIGVVDVDDSNDFFPSGLLVDNVEIQSVPEPMTILGSLVALGLGALFKKQHSQDQNRD
jgi:hypothetical protein